MEEIANVWEGLFGRLPNVIVAVIVLILAFLVAWIAKALVLKLAKVTGVERGMVKAGVKQSHAVKTVKFGGQLVQLLVFMLFMPGIFEKLGLNNVATPIVSMMNGLMVYLPNIVGAIVVLIIGLFIAKVVRELLKPLLGRLKLNEWLAKIGVNTKKVNVVDILTTSAYAVIVVLFVVEALSVLQLEMLTKVGEAIVGYLPYALSAGAVLLVAFLVGSWVETVLAKKFKTSKVTALVAKVAIDVTGVFMALSQLGVASVLVNGTFMILVGSLGIAFAVAFGAGGKDFAAKTLRKLDKKIGN